MTEIRVGSYVTHPQRPAWGLGKVFGLSDKHVLVGFQNLPASERFKRMELVTARLEVGDCTQDPLLDSWSVESDAMCREVLPLGKAKKTAMSRMPKAPLIAEWTSDQALERFKRVYADGFHDQEYARQERDWKWAKHELWEKTVSPDGFRALATTSPDRAGDLIEKMIQMKSPLLHPKGEIVPLRDAVHRPELAAAYFNTLADLLEAPSLTAEVFNNHVQALTSLPLVGKGNLTKWTIVTIIPFLVQPSRHMFLKPIRTKEITRRLGVDIQYSATPKWDTYARLLDWSNGLLEFLKPHGARDMIDVQSFGWAITQPG